MSRVVKNRQIILASKSPWRKRLLKRHGINCVIHVSDYKEVKKHVSPEKLALQNACGKAEIIARHYKNAIIIGVDTIGVLKNKIISKPKNRIDASRMLLLLAGKTHRVVSGLCVIDSKTGKKFTDVAVTRVTFNKIEKKELKKYLDSGQWKGKAGSYAIQGVAKKFVKKIDGDITNVIGIPIGALKSILSDCHPAPLSSRTCSG